MISLFSENNKAPGTPGVNKEKDGNGRKSPRQNGGRHTLFLAAALVVTACIFAAVYFFAVPKGSPLAKEITVEVILSDGGSDEFKIRTNQENLRGACDEIGLLSGREGDFGLYVLTVNGVTADESLQEWWYITKDGEMLTTSVDSTIIADGEHYEFTLTTGW